MTPDELAELAYWHVSLGQDPDGWRRFWHRLAALTAGEPVDAGSAALVGDGSRLARIVAHLAPEVAS